MSWIWQRPSWPLLTWREGDLLTPLSELARARGGLAVAIEGVGLGEWAGLEAALYAEEALGTSAIEGVDLPPASVRSSVARRLGLDAGGDGPADRHVEGLVDVLLDATRGHAGPLTADRLRAWQAALFPTGRSGLRALRVGAWREEEISVQSGPVGSERVHFRAPPAERVDAEIDALLAWWGTSAGRLEGVLRAGVVHLWFETIHPFEDGNGRVGRALADLALAQAEGGGRRLYSVSRQIVEERSAYYAALQAAQRGGLDVTDWLRWFVGCVGRAVARAHEQVDVALRRRRLREIAWAAGLETRQVKALERLLEAGPGGFAGGLTNQKYRSITGTSRATAARDLAELESRGLLVRGAEGGRSTRYELAWALLISGA